MKLLMISPGFPDDMPYFARGAAQAGATIYGVGDQPPQALRPEAAGALADYLRVGDLWNEDQTVATVVDWLRSKRIQVDAVECLWEPGVVLAAKLRQHLGLPGLSIEQAHAFRDKETMKQVLDAAGVRTPHHYRAATADEVREAAKKIGFPVIVKPIDGAGSADTYTARSDEQLEQALARVQHVPEVSVEEFIEGEEFTYDTICVGGQPQFENVAQYLPRPLAARTQSWISPVIITV
ncbi:MAG: ATP-grasp domain-containing protein, partial [Planctomycetota bacterium]